MPTASNSKERASGSRSNPLKINRSLDLPSPRRHHEIDPCERRNGWPASDRNARPASNWNAWPASSESAAGRYERSPARQDTRAGSYERTLQTKAGDVNLKVPKLRRQTFETAIIER
ncbi:transposase [Bradyrhizobium japonicum]|uniref:transposase n=1 Tax=Bradyrhizobium japonicum TaxID=375 RepID=UPI0020A22742|nr:transposase [Bradyrhizobium japonicum]